jgi:hypothetical protein
MQYKCPKIAVLEVDITYCGNCSRFAGSEQTPMVILLMNQTTCGRSTSSILRLGSISLRRVGDVLSLHVFKAHNL